MDFIIAAFYSSLNIYLPKKMEAEKWPKAADSRD